MNIPTIIVISVVVILAAFAVINVIKSKGNCCNTDCRKCNQCCKKKNNK